MSRSIYLGCEGQSSPFYRTLILGDLEGTRKAQNYLCCRKEIVFPYPRELSGKRVSLFSQNSKDTVKWQVPRQIIHRWKIGNIATLAFQGKLILYGNSLRLGNIPEDSNWDGKAKRDQFSILSPTHSLTVPKDSYLTNQEGPLETKL